MLPHEYATGSPYFAKAAEVKKIIIFKSELCLQVSRNWEQLFGTAPGSRRGQRQPGERGDGRAAGGAGRGAPPAARRKPGLGAGGGGGDRGPSPSSSGGTDLPVPGRWDRQTSPAGRGGAVRSFREWAGDESPAPGHPPGHLLLLLGGCFF